jgi:hypothetical protein
MASSDKKPLKWSDKKRIGDASRLKWEACLNRCLELGYITAEEHHGRVAMVLAATTMAEIRPAVADLDTREWNDYWNRERGAGRQPMDTIIPEAKKPAPPEGETSAPVMVPFPVFAIACLIIIVLAVLLLAGR